MKDTMRPEDDDIDSRDKPCTYALPAGSAAAAQPGRAVEHCPRHGIAASLARENRYWQRVGRD
jgi:hypothetical protein